jgi:hypothetical protein
MSKLGRKVLFLALTCTLALGIVASIGNASGQSEAKDKLEVSLSRVARITPDASGNYQFFRAAAAPDDARHLMICTLHHSLTTNKQSAEVFTSADAGETWSLRLVDGSSDEVSEDACAFGESGKGYFVAQPWNVKDPYALHSSLDKSEMRLYRSSSYAETWPAFLVSAFVDYARIAVDSRPDSPFRGRAYITGNMTGAEDLPLLAVLDDGKQLIRTKQPESFPNSHSGYWPRSLIVLRNGDVLASYLHGSKTPRGMSFSGILTTSRDGGETLTGPVTIDQDICGAVGSPSIAEDPRSGALIAFYTVKNGSSCSPALASSDDKGRSWKRLPITLQDVAKPLGDGTIEPGSITFRTDGIALLTWSVDKSVHAAIFKPSWHLLWAGNISGKVVGDEINLAPYVRREHRADNSANPDMDISLQFGFQNYAEVDTVLKGDSFVVVWRQDDGQLYSRSIRIGSREGAKAPTKTPNRDVTALVRSEARNLTFDSNTNTFEYDLALINVSNTPLPGPFLLRIKEVRTTIGAVTLKDVPTNEVVFAPEHSGTLLPGEHTSAVRVRIEASPDVLENIMSPSNDARVSIIGRVYAGPSGEPN